MGSSDLKCPCCGSKRIWKDGIRYTEKGEIQRYICRECGRRFSENIARPNPARFNRFERGQGVYTELLCNGGALPSYRQICVMEAKNLARQEAKIKAGAKSPAATNKAEIKGKILEAAWQLKKNGYSKSTIYGYSKFLRLLLKYGADLYDPESVKEVIATQETWGSSSKLMAVAAYTFFASINEIQWDPPKYKPTKTLPFIPLEREIDALISAAGKKLATTLQLIRETGMRIGEACKVRWVDVDMERNTLIVNAPEKGSNPRMFKISNKLAAMLNALPKEDERVFGRQKPKSVATNLRRLRKRIARKLQNPRLNQIHCHTLRHWKATTEYAKTRDILHVMQMLGHRSIQNTLIYTHLTKFENDQYHSAVANTIDEAKSLIEAGFAYVCTHEGAMLFRKRK